MQPGRRSILIAVLLLAVVGVAIWLSTFARGPGSRVSDRTRASLGGGASYVRFSIRFGEERIDVRAVILEPERYTAALMDQPDRQATAAAMSGIADDPATLAAINGGYFRDDFTPAGLYLLGGKSIQPVTPLSPLSAIVGIDTAGQLQLLPRDAPTDGLVAAFQTGPFIIDPGGRRGIGDQATARARRSVVALTHDRHVVVLHTSEASLLNVAKLLHGMPGLLGCGPIERAVNLDGGPSAAWVARTSPPERVDPAGPVRNFLVFQEKRPR